MLRDKVQNDIGLAAVLAAAVLLAGAAAPVRADGGDDCCADLETRIAELESTTARKGNRKVSVTVSGWVNEAVFRWDDGVQSNAYIGTNAVEQSRFRFVGEAKLDKDWSAGYVLELGLSGHASNQWNQDSARSSSANPLNGDNRVIVRKTNWYLKSKTLGQVSVGLDAMATYHMLDNADSTLTRNVDDSEGAPVFLAAFRVRIGGQFVNGLRWVDILRGFNNSTPGDGARRNLIRYDTPELFGFSASTTWGENDIWDVGVIYKGDIGDFNVQATAGYGRSNDPGITRLSVPSYVVGGTPCISGSTTTTSLPELLMHLGRRRRHRPAQADRPLPLRWAGRA